MHPFVLLPLFSCVLAAAIACALVANDPGPRINRVLAAALACSAWWSLCEVVWNAQRDPQIVLLLIRASALGWMTLGPLALQMLAEVVGGRSLPRRLLPAAWGAAAACIALYLATPWGVSEVRPTRWGWSYCPGPVFLLLYGIPTGMIGAVALLWLRFFRAVGARERREARWLLAGIAISLALASLSDVVLPYLRITAPRFGSTSLLATACVVAWNLRRNGYFLLTPEGLTGEILETLGDGVALLHPDGRIRSTNAAFARLLGQVPASLPDTPVSEILPDLPGALAGDLRDLRLSLHTAAGTIPVAVSVSRLHAAAGGELGRIVALRDLSEVTALRNHLVTSGRLAVVGELAGGIAREIGDPIREARADLIELREQWRVLADAAAGADDAPRRIAAEGVDMIRESIEGAERVASIVRGVGAFAHAGHGETRPIDLNGLLERTLRVAVLSFSVEVERCYGELPPVQADAQQLQHVFLNLILNALQAVGDYGRIRLVTQARGGWVRVYVEDDGPGIPEDEIDRVFDPFFTTRPTGKGLGLGLAHSHQIVRSHGGEIGVQSALGLGARFEVRLPVDGAAPAREGA